MVAAHKQEGIITTTNTSQNAMLLYEIQQLLIQIKACNEVGDAESADTIESISRYGLQLLHYSIYAIESQQTEIQFTSINAAGVMHEVCQELEPLAKSYGATLHFNASTNLEPVYANPDSLKGSIYALVAGVITSSINGVAPHITIAVQQTKPNEQRIGVYSETHDINLRTLNKSRYLWGRAQRMAKNGLIAKGGLGYAVSTLLAEQLDVSFLPFEHKQVPGLGFYLPQSDQLTLV
jgi:hypothetical protein